MDKQTNDKWRRWEKKAERTKQWEKDVSKPILKWEKLMLVRIPPPKRTRSHTNTSQEITLFFINFITNEKSEKEKDKEQQNKITTTSKTTNQVIELRQNTRSSHK